VESGGSGLARVWRAARPTHPFLDEIDKGACFGGRVTPGRKYSSQIDIGQFPARKNDLHTAISDLGGEHPFRNDCDACVGEYSSPHTRRAGKSSPCRRLDGHKSPLRARPGRTGLRVHRLARNRLFITGPRNGERLTQIRREIFGDNFPRSALITCSALTVPDAKIEIQEFALIGDK
jgi:hypothetical protein